MLARSATKDKRYKSKGHEQLVCPVFLLTEANNSEHRSIWKESEFKDQRYILIWRALFGRKPVEQTGQLGHLGHNGMKRLQTEIAWWWLFGERWWHLKGFCFLFTPKIGEMI